MQYAKYEHVWRCQESINFKAFVRIFGISDLSNGKTIKVLKFMIHIVFQNWVPYLLSIFVHLFGE